NSCRCVASSFSGVNADGATGSAQGLGRTARVQIPKPGNGDSFIPPRHRLFLQENEIMEQNYNVEEVDGGVPVKMWTRGVPVEDEARKQLANAARLPVVFRHIAAMPDVHVGIGATVGSVIPTLKAIIPAAGGVDIGCGMMAAKTTLRAEDLPDNLGPLRSAIERAVPHGSNPRSRGRDQGSWENPPETVDPI